MPKFHVTVKNAEGQTHTLQRESDSSVALVAVLRSEGLFPVRVQPAGSGAHFRLSRLLGSAARTRTKPKQMLAFMQNCFTLLRSGMEVERALLTLEKETTEPLKSILKGLIERVRQGESLSAAMTRAEAFSPFHVSIVRAGEFGGNLTTALQRIARSIERELDLKSKIRNAVAYPAFLICFSLFSMAVMILFVLPKFTGIYREMNAELPAMTSLILEFSTLLQKHAVWLGPSLVVGVVVIIRYLLRFRDNIMADKFRMRIWLIGPIIQTIEVSVFLRTLGLLLQSGFPVLQSLQIYASIASSAVFAKAAAEMEKGIQMGSKLSAEMRRQKLFSESTLNLVAVGEESGNLGQLLLETSESMEKQTDDLVKTLLVFIEPVLIITVGIIIGIIVISMLLPVFQLSSAIRGR